MKLLLGLLAVLLLLSGLVYVGVIASERDEERARSENLKRLNGAASAYAAAHPPTAEQTAASKKKAEANAKLQNLLNKLVDEDPNKCWDLLELSKLPKQPPYYYLSAETIEHFAGLPGDAPLLKAGERNGSPLFVCIHKEAAFLAMHPRPEWTRQSTSQPAPTAAERKAAARAALIAALKNRLNEEKK